MVPVGDIVLREFKPGTKISVPGIYSGVPIKTYHRDLCIGPSISSGGLRKIENRSLEHFFHNSYLNPESEPEPEKEAWLFGRAAHTLLLGETGFKEEFLIRPETYPSDPSKPWNGNSKDCQKWLGEAQLSGKSVLKPDAIPNIRGMADKMAAHPVIQSGILNGLVEKSICWRRRIVCESGRSVIIWLKARPDNLLTDGDMISDLKAVEDASDLSVQNALGEYGYHQQMALAMEGIKATTGRNIREAVLVHVEKKAPYGINIRPVSALAIEYGHRQNERALRKFAEAIDTGVWSGYERDEQELNLSDRTLTFLAKQAETGSLPPIPDDMDFGEGAEADPIEPDCDEAV